MDESIIHREEDRLSPLDADESEATPGNGDRPPEPAERRIRDYTAERHEWLDNWTLKDIKKDIQRMREEKAR